MSQIPPSNWTPMMQPSMLLTGNHFPGYGQTNPSGSGTNNFSDLSHTGSNSLKRSRVDSEQDKENADPKRPKEEYETSSEDDEQEDEDGEEHEDEEDIETDQPIRKTTPKQRFPPHQQQQFLGNPLAHSTPYSSSGLYNNFNSQWNTQATQLSMQPYPNWLSMGSSLNEYGNQLFNAHQMAYNFGYPGPLRPQSWGVTSPVVSSAMAHGLNAGVLPFGPNRSSDSGILVETTNSSDESSSSIRSDGVATYNDPSDSSEKNLGSSVICQVQGRLNLLSQTKKYKVTVAEILRRINAPECLNASILGGILRKAKNKDGGKALRDELKRLGIILPSGRRKSVQTTVFTALCEEEALQMARDFDELSKKSFPTKQVAMAYSQTVTSPDEAQRKRSLLIQASAAVKELIEIVKRARTEFNDTTQAGTLDATAQEPLRQFSMLTHGFGCAAHQTSWETLYTTIHESILLLDNCYPQFFGNMAISSYTTPQNFGLQMGIMPRY